MLDVMLHLSGHSMKRRQHTILEAFLNNHEEMDGAIPQALDGYSPRPPAQVATGFETRQNQMPLGTAGTLQ
jgi:hypothetical protein